MVGDTCTRREKHHNFATLGSTTTPSIKKVAFEVIEKEQIKLFKASDFFKGVVNLL